MIVPGTSQYASTAGRILLLTETDERVRGDGEQDDEIVPTQPRDVAGAPDSWNVASERAVSQNEVVECSRAERMLAGGKRAGLDVARLGGIRVRVVGRYTVGGGRPTGART